MMTTKIETCDEKLETREKGTHSQEIELALAQLQETILRVTKNFNILISNITGDPPEEQIRTEKQDTIKESVQVPLLVILKETPDQLRFMSQKLIEIEQRIEYLSGILDGSQ